MMKKMMKKMMMIVAATCIAAFTNAQVCYENTTPTTVAYAYGIGQYFDACASGDLLTIEMKLSEKTTDENQIVVRVYDDFNSEVGVYYVPNTSIWIESISPPLDNVVMVIECAQAIVEGTRYRIDISSQGSIYAADGSGQMGVAYNSAQNYILGEEEYSNYIVIPYFNSESVSPENPYGYTYKEWQMESKDIEMKISISTSLCVGDCDGDGYIGIMDVHCLIAEYGLTCAEQPLVMDLNADCVVNELDLWLFKTNYGHLCGVVGN
jgi:hypothetical protein